MDFEAERDGKEPVTVPKPIRSHESGTSEKV